MVRYFVVMLFILANNLSAQDFTLPLWTHGIPNQNNTEVQEVIDTTEIIMIRKVNKPDIAVYLPSKKYATGKAVIVIPGGGYNIIAYHWEGVDIARWLTSNGIAAIVLKYRLPHTKNNIKGYLSPLLDAKRALRLTRFNAQRWNINKNEIGVMGFSAGGHLAATLGTHFDEKNIFITDAIDTISCKPNFMILMYPVITFKEPYLHKGSRHFLIGDKPDTSLINYFSNELHVSKTTPPTFLVHAEDDKSVPVKNSLMFYEELVKNSVPAEMIIYPKGGHGFSLAIGNAHLSTWRERCIEWIKTL